MRATQGPVAVQIVIRKGPSQVLDLLRLAGHPEMRLKVSQGRVDRHIGEVHELHKLA